MPISVRRIHGYGECHRLKQKVIGFDFQIFVRQNKIGSFNRTGIATKNVQISKFAGFRASTSTKDVPFSFEPVTKTFLSFNPFWKTISAACEDEERQEGPPLEQRLAKWLYTAWVLSSGSKRDSHFDLIILGDNNIALKSSLHGASSSLAECTTAALGKLKSRRFSHSQQKCLRCAIWIKERNFLILKLRVL